MLYRELTESEEKFLTEKLDKFLSSKDGEADFTGTSISPYNLKEALFKKGFKFHIYDCNSFDYWWSYKRDDVGVVIMYFCAESFELKLYREE